MIDESAYRGRVAKARDLLAHEDVALLLVSPSSDLQYLTGYGGHASERVTLFVVGVEGQPLLLVPKLEAPRASGLAGVRLLPWEETQDPYAVLASSLELMSSGERIAVSDRTWSSVLLALQRVWSGASFEPAGSLLRALRMIKSEDEIDRLARAGAMADAAFERILELRFSGRTEKALGEQVADVLRAEGLDVSGIPIVASGPNSASPHHLTGDREIHEGDVLVLDYGGTIDGYFADITRTVHVGTPGDRFLQVYDVVQRAQEAGVQAVRPGIAAETVDDTTRQVIVSAGYDDYFIHRTGHGIGLDGHEEPYIVSGNRLLLEPGMAFSVEPGIYLPGEFGVRIEDIVVVSDGGCHRLNNATREPRVVH